MLNYLLKIGLAPIRRDIAQRPDIFNWEKAEVRGSACVAYIRAHFASKHVSFIDLTDVNDVAVMYNDRDAKRAAKKFKESAVDAIVIINCNFGNEEIAESRAVPVRYNSFHNTRPLMLAILPIC